jgi:hypothetical protein
MASMGDCTNGYFPLDSLARRGLNAMTKRTVETRTKRMCFFMSNLSFQVSDSLFSPLIRRV